MTDSIKVQTSNPGFFSKADVSTATTRRDKIQGKFYPLQHEEWLRAYKDLTDSQRGVLYYLRSLDPYSNGLRIRASKIAGDLGISRQTVYKAIDALEEKGYINKEDVEYTLKIQSKGFLCDSYSSCTQLSSENDSCKSEATAVSIERQLSSESDSCKSEATAVSVERQLSSETLTQQESQSSKINKTYTDFKKTLSEEERANFLNFCQEKIKNLSQEVNDIEAWLAHQTKAGRNRWEVYYEKYLASKQKSAKKAEAKNTLSQFRQEIEQQQRQVEKAWFESQHQDSTSNTGGAA
ncbi:MAG: helix-turn-helix domain-containing protein [Aetokthonos hydrillicola CCALA 1050]|nr:helix-turn-helix domain-containing protein [Aetokthonos hydrillicola CCALA 1050]MBW4589781.1 helix-turn-helix domain-containing protein [Aetokthonos hydrillicola CCALA 1050]